MNTVTQSTMTQMICNRSLARIRIALACIAACGLMVGCGTVVESNADKKPKIILIDPPEKEFFSKQLDFHGIGHLCFWHVRR